jgi:hypothetical protein
MDEERQSGAASDANHVEFGDASAAISPIGDAKTTVATPTPQTGQDVMASIAGKITYSVTIDEAQERFARARRKVPSIRSLQRYCQDGLIRGLRTPVTYNDGSHAEPWFMNDASLDTYIKQQPIVVLGDASDANHELATPNREVGDASAAKKESENRELPPPDPPTEGPRLIPVSEILLENARLEERLEGKTEIIQRMEGAHERQLLDLRSERDFLRTDIVETRALARDFKSISDNILGTFKQIGTKQPEAGAEKVEPSQILYKPVEPGGESRPA